MLKEVESAKEKPVKENHVIGFVDRKDQYKAHEEFSECIAAPEAIPD